MVDAGSRRAVRWLVGCLVLILLATLSWRWVARSGAPEPSFPDMQVAAYFAPWDESRGLESVRLGSGVLDEFSPVWYIPTPAGAVSRWGADVPQTAPAVVAAEARARRMRVVPAISNFRGGRWDPDVISRIVNNAGLRHAHVSALTSVVLREGWDGIDLDYESLHAKDRGAYAAFVGELGTALHRVGKQLTVTVHAKTSEPGTTPFQQAQDYGAIGRAADEVVVMAYDYSWSTSKPGPIAPIGWVRDVLRFAVSQIPRDKLLLGVATYGYEWVGQRGTDLMATDAEALARARGADVRWDRDSRSPWFTYVDAQRRSHTVWFENARSVREKMTLAGRARVRGVKLWKLGGEDPEIWQEIRQLRK